MRKYGMIILAICVMTTFSFSYAQEFRISDMKTTDTAYEAVQNVIMQKVMTLTQSNKKYYFYPEKKVTRGEFAKILAIVNSDMSSLVYTKKSSFKDVSAGSPYFRYIETEKSYIPAFNNYFKPDLFISREAVAVSLTKAMGYDKKEAVSSGIKPSCQLQSLVDDYGKATPAYQKSISIAIRNNMMNIFKQGNNSLFKPKEFITRRELALAIDSSIKLGDYDTKYSAQSRPNTSLPADKSKLLTNANKLSSDFFQTIKIGYSFGGREENQTINFRYSRTSDCGVYEQTINGEKTTTYINNIHSPKDASMYMYTKKTDSYVKQDTSFLEDFLNSNSLSRILSYPDSALNIIADNSSLTNNGNTLIMKSGFDDDNIYGLVDELASQFQGVTPEYIKGINFEITFGNQKIKDIKIEMNLFDDIQSGRISMDIHVDYSRQNIKKFIPQM